MVDIIQKKHASILTLHEHCQASTRDIAKSCNVSQTTVARIIGQFKEIESITSKRKENFGKKQKTCPRDGVYPLRMKKLESTKTSGDLQKDLSSTGVEINASLIRRQFVLGGRKATRPQKNQLLPLEMKKKKLAWTKNTLAGLRLTGRNIYIPMKAGTGKANSVYKKKIW